MTRRWKYGLGVALCLMLVIIGAMILIFETGLDERWARAAVVRRIEQSTGARVELGAFHFHLFGLRAELDNLTLHGRETEGLPPFFHADRVRVAVRILSFFGRKIALDELLVDGPEVFVRIAEDGRSNVPSPPVRRAGKPWREQLFDLRIGKLRLDDGSAEFNHARIPLAFEANDFNFAMSYDAAAPAGESYVGFFSAKQMNLAARRYLPFRSDISAKFTLTRDSFDLGELSLKLPHSDLQIRAELASFARPDWNFHYRGRFSLDDLRTILRKPSSPTGLIDFTGGARYGQGQWSATGHYRASEIALRFQWFHAGGIETWGDYEAAPGRVTIPQFGTRALNGSLAGRLEVDLKDLNFRVRSQLRGASLAAILAAVDNPSFPMHTLHWAGNVDVDSLTTWTADFKHFRATGESRWSPPSQTNPGEIPATARLDFDYSMDRKRAALAHSEITTPTTQLAMDGTLGALDSALEVQLDEKNLLVWDEFINFLRGPEAQPEPIGGRVTWKGRVLGPLAGPTFSGALHGFEARYDKLYWDELQGQMSYSPDELRLRQMQVRRGRTSMQLDLWLQFDGSWSFLPSNSWSLIARAVRAPTDDLQDLFGMSYPVSGLLSGDFHGGGTRSAPTFDGDLLLEEIKAESFRFDRLSAQLHVQEDQIGLSRAELVEDSGRVTGDFLYRPREREADFHLVGANFPLEKISKIQSSSLPIAGRIGFEIQGQGPLRAPVAHGTLQISKLHVGAEEQGDFAGQVDSDGHQVKLVVNSERTKGTFKGQLEMGLSDDYPLTGEISIQQFDLDPLIIAGLHLKDLTGHSSLDALVKLSGSLRRPETLVADADISRAIFDYEYVKLENVGPLRLSYRRNEVRVEQAEFRGMETDMRVTGFARFDRDRPLNLNVTGSVNLRLAAALLPGLESAGAAIVDATIQGTFSRPLITGRVSVSDASVHYGDFPTGLNHVKGEFLFSRNRLLFDNVTAQAGGGTLTLSGSLSFGDMPLQYEVNADATRTIIRYPQGVSWLAGGNLQLAGTANGALLSGNVQVERLLLAEGTDIATFFASSSQEAVHGPATSSPYLRNLQFDVQGTTTPNARLEWTGAHIEMDGDVRLRGTWDNPLLLGHIHLLSGEMPFRGNIYRLTRGDVNFSNPFRLDPVLNVEATTTISQYQVTIDFTGPASRLNLSYRSDPPLPDSDIVALLALGSPGEQSALRSSTSGSQSYGATALLSEAISSQLGGRIERLFGISHFRVDPFLAGTTTEQNAAARVTIQQQVTRDLTVTYSSNATSNQQYQLIQVEYAIRRDISVVFLRDINATYSLTIEFRQHFK